MAEAIELKRPGIEILQVFEAVSPTIITPTLMPCIHGVCKQIVEVIELSATGGSQLNSDARCTIPAWFEVAGTSYAGLDGLNLGLSVNNSPVISIEFTDAGGGLSNKAVVDTVNQALADNQLNSYAYAEVLYSGIDQIGWRLRTVSVGDTQTIKVSAPATTDRPVLVAFDLGEDHVFSGNDTYQGYGLQIPFFAYPDPRNNISELALDADTSRFFLWTGTGVTLQETTRSEALLSYGVVGSVGDASAIAPQDDSDGDATTPLIRFTGEDFTVAGAAIEVTGTVDTTGLTYPADLEGKTIELDDGSGPQVFTFRSVADQADLLVQLEAAFGSAVGGKLSFSTDVSEFLVITTDEKGADAFLEIVAGGTALAVLGLTAGAHVGDHSDSGGTPVIAPFPPQAGDDLYVDGSYRGRILEVAPGGVATDLKLDTEVLISTPVPAWSSYYIVARNLPAAGSATRPKPDLMVSATGAMTVKPALARDITGVPIQPSSQMYSYYEALRLDVSTAADDPALLRFDDTTDVTDLIDPVSVDNPLALGLYFALLNSSNAQVSGIAVDEISADQPYGTTDAYERVLEFLESKDVYTLVPLTHDMTVAALELTHVVTMSEPDYKGERICLFASEFPTRAPDTSIASGTDGNAAGTPSALFSTGISNLSQLVLAAGVTPTGTIDPDEGLYLDIAADDAHYSIKSISGDTLTLRYQAGDFTAGENDDSFYAEDYVPQTVSGTFAIRKRGDLLVDANGAADKNAIADAYQDIAVSFNNRRFWHHALNNVRATLDGIEQVLPGFYWCAAKAGAICGQPPQQSFTNFPITGFSGVTGTGEFFSDRQMNRMAAGGNCIPLQELVSGPIFERMSLTTDMTSIETRTDSITKALDFTAKFLRKMLRTYIGKFNINQNYLDTLSHVISGARAFLTGTGVLVDMDVNEIIQDADEPDSVGVDITADPPYPCNYIRVRLSI